MTVDKPSKEQLAQEETKKKDADEAKEALPSYEAVQQDELSIPAFPPLEFYALESSKTVDRNRCILHLKLLAALADLRDTISSIDGLFGIGDSLADKFVDEATKYKALVRIREKRWAVYTARAADRYVDWWTKILPSSGDPVTVSSMRSTSYNSITRPLLSPLSWTTKKLPPLDVLMVWHAHMLNPRAYLEDCIRETRMNIWTADFPWKLVDNAIDAQSFDYDPGEDARQHFEKTSGRPWNNLDESEQKKFKCLLCSAQLTVPWTTGEFGASPDSAFKYCTGHRVLDSTEADRNIRNMNGVKALLESLMADPQLVMRVKVRPRVKLSRTQKISIRRMMSHYWENSSIFSLDLVGAVIRQGTFIQKMDNIDWIHSPALSATMDRLIRKYRIFFEIMMDNRGKMAVPTLDVDLAWHTHQMSPFRYCNYSRTQSLRLGAQIFIDHDDKVDEGKLSDAFQWTSKQYMKVTNGELYSECTCWYCEASRESFLYSSLPFPSSSTRRSRTLVENLHDDPQISSNPDKNPHISAHNAVRIEDGHGWAQNSANLKAMRLRQMWEKAHRRAQKRQKKQGKATGSDSEDRNRSTRSTDATDPYYPMIYGYPYFVPYYAPYMADPGINSAIYPCNPACMSAGLSSYGNCAAGTCGSGVAAGACAGAGGGAGCGGGACGGGGGGGGGGGCGGGGGGGGGCGGGGGG
ncbi:hypothetical protein UA08_00055 [Talaromyces atroroseus]|uniref:Uncharacterized protein n=1 Tax=Talaromyces atroroseus TaxID=1441469 RepID=A0A225B1M6_TALAT|nr:hypothetical protein UA08_00055 [Talaromyces atroroseus]OKL63608.1 hypothetical protein UA08_00055 [Talaromyces atroroseus]